MAIGNDYNVKQDLINAVVAKVFKNDTFGITGEGLQKALCDMIESLWGDNNGAGVGNANIINLSYAQLSVHVAAGTLVPGTWYRFDFENVHAVTDTLLTNTTVPGYTQIIEKFLVLATHTNTLSAFALSEDNPYDVIEYNQTQSSHGSPAVLDNGTVIRRYDILNDNEAYFDFRNYTVARFPLDLATISSPTLVDRSKIYKDISNNNIGISVRDDSTPSNFRLVDDISDIAESQPYYTLNGGSLELFTNTLSLSSTPVYFPSFHTSADIHSGIKLGKGVTNVLISNSNTFNTGGTVCKNIKIENDSSGITILSSTNINIGEESSNVLIKNSNDIDLGKKSSKVLIFGSQKAEVGKNCSEILLIESNDTEIKNTANDILILRSNYTEIGTKNSSIFVIRQSNKNVFGNSCGAISLGSTTANDFRASCTAIDIYSGGYNRFAQGCNLINLVGEQDASFVGGNYYSPYSEMSHNTFGIACSNISFSGINGGRGNMFGDECANLMFGGISTGTGYIGGPSLMNTNFCRGIRNKTFKDFPLNSFSFITPNSDTKIIDYTSWYSQIISVRQKGLSESTAPEFHLEIEDDAVSNNATFSIEFENWPVGNQSVLNYAITYTTPATGTVTKASATAGLIAAINLQYANSAKSQGDGITVSMTLGYFYIKAQSSNLMSRPLSVEGMVTKNNHWWAGKDSSSTDIIVTYENSSGSGLFTNTFNPPNGIKGTGTHPNKSTGYNIDHAPQGGAYTWTSNGNPLSVLITNNINPQTFQGVDFEAHTDTASPRPAPLP